MRISDWSSDVCSSDLAASTEARRRPGWRAITSSAEVPIEPVAPRTATDCMVEAGMVGAGMSETEQFLAEQEHRQRGEHAVEAVEDAAVARDHAARVLGAAVRSEEHTSELQALMRISYAVFCLKKQKTEQ